MAYLVAGIFIPDLNSLLAFDIFPRGDYGTSMNSGALVFSLADAAAITTSLIYSLPLLAASTRTGRSKLRL
jgi:hypothetical protein